METTLMKIKFHCGILKNKSWNQIDSVEFVPENIFFKETHVSIIVGNICTHNVLGFSPS